MLHKITEVQEDVEIALTLYGTKLANSLSYGIYGVKVIDIRSSNLSNNLKQKNVHSQDLSCAFEYHLTKDNKEARKTLKECSEQGLILNEKVFSEYESEREEMKVQVSTPKNISTA